VDDKLKKRTLSPDADSDDVELEDVDADEAIEDAEELEDDTEDLGEEIEVDTDRDEEG